MFLKDFSVYINIIDDIELENYLYSEKSCSSASSKANCLISHLYSASYISNLVKSLAKSGSGRKLSWTFFVIKDLSEKKCLILVAFNHLKNSR